MSPEQLLGELEGDDAFVVADLEAGTGTMLRMQPGMADVAVVVAQPTTKALDVAGRALRTSLSRGVRVIVVANRVRGDEDVDMVRDALGDHETVVVPEDRAIAAADRQGTAPFDFASDARGVQALVGLAERLAGDGVR